MSPILTALKALYIALGGALTDHYDDIAGGIPVSQMVLTADLVACLAKLSIGIELPAVTAADDGDVLTVVSGKWAKAAAAGGKTLYSHNLRIGLDDDDLGSIIAICSIVTDSSAPMALTDLSGYMASTHAEIVVNGYCMSGTNNAPAYLYLSGSKVFVQLVDESTQVEVTADATITDAVVEL